MLGLIVCSAILAAEPTSPPPATYAEARALAGRSPDDQVRLALWCEAHGLAAERLHHLALAVLADPRHATARGLLGLVDYRGRYHRPEAVADGIKADAALAEYQTRRGQAAYTAEGQWQLGVWADDHGLKDQARAHFTAVTRLDPSRDHAWKRLGYRKYGDRWLTEAQHLAEKDEAEAQKLADRRWKPILEKARLMLASPGRRDAAEAILASVTDPRAVPSIGRVFAVVEPLQARAVQLLGQIDSPSSSRSLAVMALLARSAEARRMATEILRGRDTREYADYLISQLRDTVKYEVRPGEGLGSTGEILVEGERFNFRRLYKTPEVFRAGDRLDRDASGQVVVTRNVGTSTGEVDLGALLSASRTSRDSAPIGGMNSQAEVRQAVSIARNIAANGLNQSPGRYRFLFGDTVQITLDQMKGEAQKSKAATDRQLRDDIDFLDDFNVAVRIGNDRASGVLAGATGRSLPSDRGAWSRWWSDQIGYASAAPEWTSRPSVTEDVAINYQPPALPDGVSRDIIGYDRYDCLVAGTSIRTIAGPRAIESLEVGDQVLTQSTTTGALGYRPVVVLHRNPPAATFKIELPGESIVASHFHRFWVAGRGWVMARDLQPGDPIRTLGGVASIRSVGADKVQPVFNLDVADDADFFAGKLAALVHDNTLPDPRLVPFDAPKDR